MPTPSNFDFSKRITTIPTTGIINDLIVDTYVVNFTGNNITTLTGIDFPTNRMGGVCLFNKTNANLILKHNSLLSRVGNRFFLIEEQDFILAPDSSIQLIYSGENNGYILIDSYQTTNQTTGSYLITGGRAIFSGDGSQIEFLIPHTLPGIPIISVTPGSTDAASSFGYYVTTVDSTNITILFDAPPEMEVNNIVFFWLAILL